MNDQMSAYVWWWVNEGDTSVNLVSNDGTIFKNGYIMGQFAKWVRPGKQRIASTYEPDSGVYVTAYRNGGWVIVAVNTTNSAVDQQFVLSGSGLPTEFQAYRTSATENMANVGNYNVLDGSFTNRLPAQSVTTFVQGTYYTIDATASAGGSILQNPTGSSLAVGTQVSFTAVPNTEWKFAGWSGDYTGTDSVYTISSLDSDVTLNASFVPVNPYLYEAEYAQMHDVVVVSSSPGYSGTGYADFGGVGSSIELPVYVTESGKTVFAITYANGGGVDRGVSVTVNGTEVTSLLNFPVTGGWAQWKTVNVSLNLEQGINTIKLTTVTDAGGPNVDKLEIETVKAIRDKKEVDFGVKHNPAKFTVQAYKPGADLNVTVYSINGQVVFTRKIRLGSSAAVTGLPLRSLTRGSYLLETSLDGVTEVRKIEIVR